MRSAGVLLDQVTRAWHVQVFHGAPYERCREGFCPEVRAALAQAQVFPDGTIQVETVEAAVRLSAEQVAVAAGASAAARILGSAGGKKSRKTSHLPPERRAEIARRAAEKRWGRREA